ncbi:MAG TPA: hypothetical protein VF326_08455 [Anaerolineaceae bacterium]|jgi:hypothetical protein
MSQDPQKTAEQHHSPAYLKRLLLPVALFCFFVILIFIAGIAWRQLDPYNMAHLQSTTANIKPLAQLPVLTPEINEQTRESSGIILASVVIVFIILGGTYGATRRKMP